MHLDLSLRRVRLSVGELANFSLTPGRSSEAPSGLWRMESGRTWHRSLQSEAAANAAQAGTTIAHEVALEGIWTADSWQLHLQGRVDEIESTAERHCLREIKTVRRALPADPEELRSLYPGYFAQLSSYLELARLLPAWNDRPLAGELIFADIDEGFTQIIPLDPGEPGHRHGQQVGRLLGFLRAREEAHDARAALPVRAPFANWRPGQAETARRLTDVATRAPIILFEAPTGFGKTGLALAHAFDELRSGRISRVVILSGKSSGQTPLIAQLERMLGDQDGVRYLQMRNRTELAPAAPTAPLDPVALRARWNEAGERLEEFFDGATVTPEALRRIGHRLELDPHALARALLALADVWVGDYNYQFAPGSQGVFADVPGFDPAQTMLIVDEAHNLATRVAGAWSHRFNAADWHVLENELARLDWPSLFLRELRALAAFLDPLRPCDELDPMLQLEGQAILRKIGETVLREPLPWEEAPPFAVELLWQTPAAVKALDHALLPFLSWSPGPGQWALTCLDPAAEIGPHLASFAATVLMSATLQPVAHTCRALGLPVPGDRAASGQVASLEAEAPWREDAYSVAIDARVNTRFAHRARSIPRTAGAVARLAAFDPDPIVVFFSSYRYAADVAARLEWDAPHLRIALQPRGLDLPAQSEFLEMALLTSQALFLILGSSFAEGIDQLGGRVRTAMIVGPALPEVNPVQEAARAEARTRGEANPFRRVYQIPGINRIHQALGRLVRAPGHRARVLLHGERFAAPETFDLLRPEFQTPVVIRSDDDFEAWLRSLPSL